MDSVNFALYVKFWLGVSRVDKKGIPTTTININSTRFNLLVSCNRSWLEERFKRGQCGWSHAVARHFAWILLRCSKADIGMFSWGTIDSRQPSLLLKASPPFSSSAPQTRSQISSKRSRGVGVFSSASWRLGNEARRLEKASDFLVAGGSQNNAERPASARYEWRGSGERVGRWKKPQIKFKCISYLVVIDTGIRRRLQAFEIPPQRRCEPQQTWYSFSADIPSLRELTSIIITTCKLWGFVKENAFSQQQCKCISLCNTATTRKTGHKPTTHKKGRVCLSQPEVILGSAVPLSIETRPVAELTRKLRANMVAQVCLVTQPHETSSLDTGRHYEASRRSG